MIVDLFIQIWYLQPPPPSQHIDPYVPEPSVIEQNELFDFALKAAPNVLYSRYKQYGQVCLSSANTFSTDDCHSAWSVSLVL